MNGERVSATASIAASADAIFAVLANPADHAAVDGTGWVCGSRDRERLTAPGQVFRMDMHHEDHPNGDYRTANRVRVLERPTAISWETGYETSDGSLRFGGWIWRYDLMSTGPFTTEVTLSYDWSAVPTSVREYLQFPPFRPEHLDDSLGHLAELVTARSSRDARSRH